LPLHLHHLSLIHPFLVYAFTDCDGSRLSAHF
jgi:hypothetical protein